MGKKFKRGLWYKKDGVTLFTDDGDENVEIILEKTEEYRRATIRAKTDIEPIFYRKPSIYVADEEETMFFNGYQSWTDSRESYVNEYEKDVKKIPKFLLKKFAFDRYGDSWFYESGENILHGYDVFYSRGTNEVFYFNGLIGQHLLLFEVDKPTGELCIASDLEGVKLKAGEEMEVLKYYRAYSFQKGLELFNKIYPKKDVKKIFGYTSWYKLYQNINEQVLLSDLDALDERFNLFQIDDGYQTFVGDWLDVDTKKFPNGLKPLVEKAHETGKMAGLWLAPLVAETKSKLFNEHPEYFAKVDGEFACCGSNWSGFYALDIYNEDARAYIKKCLTHYADMGFDFFKLDFLYAATMCKKEGKTRGMVTEDAYAFLRECLGDKLILGCGAIIFNAIGKFDYMRVGPDVSLKFDDVWYMRAVHRERISTKVTIQNTIYRSFMDKHLFGNDPDVFLLRDKNISLSKAQKKALLTINALFGSVLMTSDNIAEYGDEAKAELDEALRLWNEATVLKYSRDGARIDIEYMLDGEKKKIVYDTIRGVIL